MGAVKDGHRDSNLGFNLKLAQAIHVSEQGVSEVRWTYDLMRSRNAYLNLHKLGAVATGFYVNKYGNSLDCSQNSDNTDYLLARWFIDEPTTVNRLVNGPESASLGDTPVVSPDNLIGANRVAMEIPIEIDSLDDYEKLRQRLELRALASNYINKQGYVAVAYFVNSDKRGYYILEKSNIT